ncbi:CTD kinase subunit gamma CTK3 [Ceraceosorus bombacis]|uniref:CTD kinase subunit gamma CTK3 n=2 Tax=Ceraceosorus TaxID=401624 RepID=A0A0N7LAF7_9BASI|nr:CTD kinase subunit gamma CTK3 [Ceraceosorus bombacis]
MDAFSIRLDFLSLLRRLTASQQSIAKLIAFANVHADKARNDIWDCTVGEAEKTNLNARLNILFFIDALLSEENAGSTSQQPASPSLLPMDEGSMAAAGGGYHALATRDLKKLLHFTVPDTWQGIRLNAANALTVSRVWWTVSRFHLSQLLAVKRNKSADMTLDHRNDIWDCTVGEAEKGDSTLAWCTPKRRE